MFSKLVNSNTLGLGGNLLHRGNNFIARQPKKFKPTSLIPSLVALYGLHNLATSKEDSASKNECGGILAYISKGNDDARQFCQTNAHLLQKTPYQ